MYFILSLKRALALHPLQPGSQSSAWLLSARISDEAFGCGASGILPVDRLYTEGLKVRD